LGTVSWETDGRGCDEAYRTHFEYDTLGRLESTDPPLSEPTTFEYYNDWTQVKVIRDTQEFLYVFDRFGNLKEVFDAQTGHLTQITTDALGRRRQVDFLWNPEPGDTLTYDPLGRLTAVVHPDEPSTRITYDYSGSVVTVLDENLHETTYHYEAYGDPSSRRLAYLVDAAGETTSYGYDSNLGLLQSVSAPVSQGDRGFSYYYGSNGCDNGFLASETHPESLTTFYEYDCLGNVAKRTLANSETATYDYDSAGRLIEIRYLNASDDVTMGYDGASRRTLLENHGAVVESTYDDAGRLETTTHSFTGGPQGHTTAYSYDRLDRLDTITYPSGRVVTHGWNDRNWMVSLTGEEGSDVEYLPNITYHKTGAPDVVTYANGISTKHWIDDRNRLVGITSPGLMQIGIVHDDASNVEEWNDFYDPENSRIYGYDELDRLTTATAPGLWGELIFTYDKLGNRRTRTLEGETTDYYYDEYRNQLHRLAAAETNRFTYDLVGRLIMEERGASYFEVFSDGFETGDFAEWEENSAKSESDYPLRFLYSYNSAGHLTRVSQDGQFLADYSYDGDGLRVKKSSAAGAVYYLRNPTGNALAEYDQDGALLAEYVYAGDRQVAKVEPTGGDEDDFSFFHADHLGSSMIISGGNGEIKWYGQYFPFGGPYSSTGVPDRYRFTQHELDTETSLVYAKARYYHPWLGRFISTDPVGGNVGSSQSWNRYAYVENRPLSAQDTDGRAGAIIYTDFVPDEVFQANAETRLEINRFFARGGVFGEIAGAVIDIALSEYLPESREALLSTLVENSATVGVPVATLVRLPKGTKSYQTYVKKKPDGTPYFGKTSGEGTPQQNIARRDSTHHMNQEGYGPAQLDKTSSNPDAIRGREQQLIEVHGGAQSQGGTIGNKINSVSPRNPKRKQYQEAAEEEFGGS
jgi:RHS repeat-associated protein